MKLSDLRKSLKKNRFVYFTYRKLADRDYRSGLRNYNPGKGIKSRETIEKELSLVRSYWKCDPMHYFRYRLYEKELSDEELIDYVPAYYFYNFHMQSVNDERMVPVIASKFRLFELFRRKNIPSPVTVAFLKKGTLSDTWGKDMSFPSFLNTLNQSPSDLFFVKPDLGKGGKGIFTIKKKDGRFELDGNTPLDQNSISRVTGNGDFIIQEAIKQRSDVSSIYPVSVNTLRVIIQNDGNDCRIAAVVMRIGRNGSFVDNSSRGGISVSIDVDSGRLSRYAFTEHTMEKFERHPDTGAVFGEFTLSGWDKIKHDILENALKMPELAEAGWDIAITGDGIVVIEMNLNYALDLLQCCSGGLRRKLNVLPAY